MEAEVVVAAMTMIATSTDNVARRMTGDSSSRAKLLTLMRRAGL
jgi:hypothetical protein